MLTRICRQWGFVVLTVLLCMLITAVDARANPKYASLIVDAKTGDVLHQSNAHKFRYPASLTKMMTLYLTFEAIEQGRLHVTQQLPVSRHAASMPASKLGFKPGDKIRVRDAILSLVVKSANDAAVVLAEAVGGSEEHFARMMTRKARRLGMRQTTFRNASGLHHIRQRTNAYDMARLAMALQRDFPRYYHLFSRKRFYYRGRVYKTHNHNLRKYKGADGLKTGYIDASGYNVVTSAKRDGIRLVGVVLGGKTASRRDRHMRKLLDKSFKLAQVSPSRYSKSPVPVLKRQARFSPPPAGKKPPQLTSLPIPKLKPVFKRLKSSLKRVAQRATPKPLTDVKLNNMLHRDSNRVFMP